MKKLIAFTIIITVSSCGFQDGKTYEIHNRKEDGWDFIQFRDYDILIDVFDGTGSSSTRYCLLFGVKSCMFVKEKGLFYIQIDTTESDYEKTLTHFKKHIVLFDAGYNVNYHHRYIDCNELCNKNHIFWEMEE